MTEGNNKRIGRKIQLPVTKLRGQFHLHINVCQFFKDISADTTGIVGRSAGNDHQVTTCLQPFPDRHDPSQLGDALPRFKTTPECVFYGLRLFIDLLEHEMREPVQIRVFSPPLHGLGITFDGLCLGRGYGKTIGGKGGQFIVLKVNDLVGIPYHCRNVGCSKMSVIAYADNQRTASSGDHNLIRNTSVDNSQAESSFHLRHGLPHGLTEAALEVYAYQLGQDLRIGLRSEYDPMLLQFFLDGQVIFDNTIVYKKNVFVLIPVGMRIFFRRLTMGCPTGVCNSY